MSSPSKENEEPTSSAVAADSGANGRFADSTASDGPRPPAKRPISNAVIEISDTESDDSDVCAVTSYQASADEVKRIRGDDYSSSSSSSSDYSSDSDNGWEDDSIVIPDEVVNRKFVNAKLYPRANRMEDPKLNNMILSQELIDRLKIHWQDCKDLKTNEVTLSSEPFRLCQLHNILSNPDIINNIVDDMNTLDWSRKKMDLFEFHQTMDLASLTWQRSIRGIYELLKTEVMNWVSKVTGLELTSVSASCSLYGPGDHLLVHDDRLGDRRVAFILYLTPWQPAVADHSGVHNGGADHAQCESNKGWRPHMGGALELLGCDDNGPTEVMHSVYPTNNMLAFFQVAHNSYHQVSEVLSVEVPRLSINGWFHGPAAPAPPAPSPPDQLADYAPDVCKPHNEVVVMSSMITGAWMSPRARGLVQAQVERDSEASLRGLLNEEALASLRASLTSPDLPWKYCGPANRRRYETLPSTWLRDQPPQHPIKKLLQLVTSMPYQRLLVDCTDLAITSYSGVELQRWRPGDYTLLPPREHYQSSRLETALYILSSEEAPAGRGGGTIFVAAEEDTVDTALAELPVGDNTLGMVFCEPGTARFTQYRGKLASDPNYCFYILTSTYME